MMNTEGGVRRPRLIANIFGWCPDPDCGADVMGGEAHDPMCQLSKCSEQREEEEEHVTTETSPNRSV